MPMHKGTNLLDLLLLLLPEDLADHIHDSVPLRF